MEYLLCIGWALYGDLTIHCYDEINFRSIDSVYGMLRVKTAMPFKLALHDSFVGNSLEYVCFRTTRMARRNKEFEFKTEFEPCWPETCYIVFHMHLRSSLRSAAFLDWRNDASSANTAELPF